MPAELPGVPNQPFRLLWCQVLAGPTRSIRRAFRHDFPVFDVWADASLGPQCDDVAHADDPHFRYLGPFTECLPVPSGAVPPPRSLSPPSRSLRPSAALSSACISSSVSCFAVERGAAPWFCLCASFGEAPEKVCPTIQPCLKIGSSAGSGGKKSLPVPVFAPVEVREDGFLDLRLLMMRVLPARGVVCR